jgi:hypothetical protein
MNFMWDPGMVSFHPPILPGQTSLC